MNIFTETEKLAEAQLQEFELAKINYANLKKAAYKTIPIGTYTFELQYNPDRIRSTAANITPRVLQSRKCFLCSENLPAGQKVFHTDKTTISSSIPIRFFKSISQFRPRHTPLSS